MLKRSSSEILEVIEQVPLFSGLSKRHLREVAAVGSDVQYEPGDVILAQQDAAQHMAVIIAGRATVVRNGRNIATVGAGDSVGEMSLIDGSRRSASVVAETAVDAVLIYATAFRKLLEREPSICAGLLRSQTQRLRELDKRMALHG